jgi:hypothetical protein
LIIKKKLNKNVIILWKAKWKKSETQFLTNQMWKNKIGNKSWGTEKKKKAWTSPFDYVNHSLNLKKKKGLGISLSFKFDSWNSNYSKPNKLNFVSQNQELTK